MEVYLDHAATTPVRPEAREVMTGLLRAGPGNPSGAHEPARRARRALDDARDALARVLGCEPGDVVFTSGGTEADNLAVLGVHDALGGTVVCSAVEHPAVLRPTLSRGGRVVPVGGDGRIDLDALAGAIDADVSLVSVMAVNNEVGTVQPVAGVVEVVRRQAPRALVHCDAVQAVPWLPVADVLRGVDLVSISAHKFGGPPGVGALVVRSGATPSPRQLGGGQERERRSGTQNVPAAAAMAVAATAVSAHRGEEVARVGALRDRLLAGLLERVDACGETGSPDPLAGWGPTLDGPSRPSGWADTAGRAGVAPRAPGILPLWFEGVESEALLFMLDESGIAASAGSSCASGSLERSPVLAAMGVPPERAAGALRLSLGWSTTAAEIDRALEVIPQVVGRLRSRSGALR